VVKRFLITTALETSWCDDEPVLFLGEWCKLYHRKEVWEGLDAKTLPYHWDDRGKLFADYQYLTILYERLLKELASQLNQIHNVNHSLRYWRILIGPWLGYFIQMLFDRWESVQKAVQLYDLSGAIVLSGTDETLVPKNMRDFTHLYTGDEWNHYLYSYIVMNFTKIPYVTHVLKKSPKVEVGNIVFDFKRSIKRVTAAIYFKFASLLTQDQDAFILASYLPTLDEVKMHFRLGQVPQLWRPVSAKECMVDKNKRQWSLIGENVSEFESCVRSLIPLQIPTAYLEGYEALVDQAARLPWPSEPKVIWTSNSYSADDVFKVWSAGKVEQGSPLVIGQHGGHYGVGRWSFSEEHQIKISDFFLSWGWSTPNEPKVVPLGQLKSKRPLGVQHSKQPGILLVTYTCPRHSYHMYSIAASSQWLSYFDDQCVFVESLPSHLRDALTVRLHPDDHGWSHRERWQDRFPSIRIDDGKSNVINLVRRSRLYVSTYNSTTYLESFTMNAPTVIYWDPNYWELRASAIPYYEELKRVGIFHETPASAAEHVAEIWDDVDQWWNSSEVQKALEQFKKKYSHLPSNLLDCVDGILQKIITSPHSSIK
jgi:putative transferase (TIGR04331 family)